MRSHNWPSHEFLNVQRRLSSSRRANIRHQLRLSTLDSRCCPQSWGPSCPANTSLDPAVPSRCSFSLAPDQWQLSVCNWNHFTSVKMKSDFCVHLFAGGHDPCCVWLGVHNVTDGRVYQRGASKSPAACAEGQPAEAAANAAAAGPAASAPPAHSVQQHRRGAGGVQLAARAGRQRPGTDGVDEPRRPRRLPQPGAQAGRAGSCAHQPRPGPWLPAVRVGRSVDTVPGDAAAQTARGRQGRFPAAEPGRGARAAAAGAAPQPQEACRHPALLSFGLMSGSAAVAGGLILFVTEINIGQFARV